MLCSSIRPLAFALVLSHLLAAGLPCPVGGVPAGPTHRADAAHEDPAHSTGSGVHVHHAEPRDEPTANPTPDCFLSPACPCGCADAPAPGGTASRLRLGPLSGSIEVVRPSPTRLAPAPAPLQVATSASAPDPVPI